MKNKQHFNNSLISNNRRASFDYELMDSFEAGLILVGSEVKSLRLGGVKLDNAHVQAASDNSLEIVNLHISEYSHCNPKFQHKVNRVRKLLLHQREIKKILNKISIDGMTVILKKIYFNDRGLVKVTLCLAKGKKKVDKRNIIKEKDWKISKQRIMKHYNI